MRIKLKDIFVGERQRTSYDSQGMMELVNDLRDNGQIQPIAVRPVLEEEKGQADYTDQPWVLIAGGRRFMAATMLGWEELEGYAREEMSLLVAQTLELHENLIRRNLTWQEQVLATKKLLELRKQENPDIKDWEVAAELGVAPASLSADVKAAKILEENPSLGKAATKHGALRLGKALEEAKQNAVERNLREKLQSAIPPAEERIVTADAVEWLRQQEAESVDLFLLDGPYGYDYWKLGHKSGETVSAFDDSEETTLSLYEQVVPELARVVRPTGWVVMFCSRELFQPLYDWTGKAGLKPSPIPWYWYRPNSRNRPRFPGLHAQNMVEIMLVCNGGKARLTREVGNLLEFDAEYGSGRVHANQKPLALLQELVDRLSFSGDVVADCFFGSGSGLAAAASRGRVAIGCDSNPTMLPLALGYVHKVEKPILSDALESSARRRKEAAEAGPAAPSTGLWHHESHGPLPGIGYAIQVKRDGWVLGHAKAPTKEAADELATYLVDCLSQMESDEELAELTVDAIGVEVSKLLKKASL